MLKDEIEAAKRSVNTDRVQITIGEVATMYTADELNILPDFQRLHRWSVVKKSNFIESVLIGIPIPPIFVFETNTGVWELVDGLQRISTILEFMGVLQDVDHPGRTKRSVLSAAKYLPDLEGVVWRAQSDNERPLDKSLQLFFRRARLDFEILKHPSDPTTKFDLFQRLNRGGVYANDQEVRTCSMVYADTQFTTQLRTFITSEDFRKLFRVTAEQRKTQKDLEYLVRLIVHAHVDYSDRMDVHEFLNNGILQIIEEGRQREALAVAEWVVRTLRRIGGADALLPPPERVDGISETRFSLRALEVIAVGLARNKGAIEKHGREADDFILERIAAFWQDPIAAELSRRGLRGTTRIQKSIPFGLKWFNPDAQA